MSVLKFGERVEALRYARSARRDESAVAGIVAHFTKWVNPVRWPTPGLPRCGWIKPYDGYSQTILDRAAKQLQQIKDSDILL